MAKFDQDDDNDDHHKDSQNQRQSPPDDHDDGKNKNPKDKPHCHDSSPRINPTCLDDNCSEEKNSFVFGERHDDGKIYLREIRPDGDLFVGKDGGVSRSLLPVDSSITAGSILSEFTNTRSGKEFRTKQNEELDQNLDEDEIPSSNHDSNDDTLLVTNQQIVDPYGENGVYTGALSKSTGMPNGKGRLDYEKEGRWYDGDWIHGRWTGFGIVSNGDGDLYEGGLKNDHKHGTGVMRFADGRVFAGEYVQGQMIQGKMTYQDGTVYEGGWVDGMRHGQGKCTFVDGSEYEGEFRAGDFHGHGRMTWNDGGSFVGEWRDGEMQPTCIIL